MRTPRQEEWALGQSWARGGTGPAHFPEEGQGRREGDGAAESGVLGTAWPSWQLKAHPSQGQARVGGSLCPRVPLRLSPTEGHGASPLAGGDHYLLVPGHHIGRTLPHSPTPAFGTRGCWEAEYTCWPIGRSLLWSILRDLQLSSRQLSPSPAGFLAGTGRAPTPTFHPARKAGRPPASASAPSSGLVLL